MENDDFADVSWQNDDPNKNTGPKAPIPGGDGTMSSNAGMKTAHQAGGPGVSTDVRGRDPLDFAGVGAAILECIVDTPIKENEGTKDTFVSYLVTTNVRLTSLSANAKLIQKSDELPLLSEAYHISQKTIHRFRILIPDTLLRVPGMRSSPVT